MFSIISKTSFIILSNLVYCLQFLSNWTGLNFLTFDKELTKYKATVYSNDRYYLSKFLHDTYAAINGNRTMTISQCCLQKQQS